jgi:hypothetical protein
MPALFSLSSISYSIVAIVLLGFGAVYLTRNQFLPYHGQAIGLSWSQVDPNLQILILALMRVAGTGFVVAGLAMLVLLLIPWRAGETWSLYAIPAISFCACFGSIYATFLVKTKTPGTPPLRLSILGLVLTMMGLIFSII